ncbi:MAG: phosphoribosylglycinamide formyltransferase [Rhodothermales bacterium]
MRLAVFASGGGSNFKSIINAVQRGDLPETEIGLCLSNKPSAGALQHAAASEIPTAILHPSSFDSEAAYSDALLATLHAHQVDFIALAGYMLKIPSLVVETYVNRMVNIHPSLLPAFGGQGLYGRRVHEAVLGAGVRWTGATVHLVDDDYDTGPIVVQEPVLVEQTDTPETLAARVLKTEHRLYPQAIRLFAEGRVRVKDRAVWIAPPAS